MRLEKILDKLNSFEKNSFLKIIDAILAESPKNAQKIEQIISDYSGDLKSIDNQNIARVFELVEYEFRLHVSREFDNVTSQIDILIDILIRDGNCIMKQDWLSRLYDRELKSLTAKIKNLEDSFTNNNDDSRCRDYLIYQSCVKEAYFNDEKNNQEPKITSGEQSILHVLSQKLELSKQEVKLINYTVIPIVKLAVDKIIDLLKSIGIIFYSKKSNIIYVADEMVRLLRKIRGKEIADKFYRRTLRMIREPNINLICKKHNIDWKQDFDYKVRAIINEGISFTGLLSNDVFRQGTKVSDKKKFINELCDKHLKITPSLKGSTLEDKLSNLLFYFEEIDKDQRVGISHDGYEKLLAELKESLPKVNTQLKAEFELQDENVLDSEYLLDYNIKPRDVLEVMNEDDLAKFGKEQEAKLRGDMVGNILEVFKDSENMYLENYEAFGFRDLKTLRENGIKIRESELGLKFEKLTEKIFENLRFNVDHGLKKDVNTKKDKVDIVLNIGKNELIIVECKTIKESGYNKFSSVKRQLKSYEDEAKHKGYRVIKSILVAPDFSDDFIKDVGLEYDLNLSLITASSLLQIMHGFKKSRLKKFPYNLLMRDVLIQESRVLKAIDK